MALFWADEVSTEVSWRGLTNERAVVLAVLGAAPRLLEVLRAAGGDAALTPAEAHLAGELGAWVVRLEAEASVLGFGESGA